ncbi:MAG: hypothetical protein ACX93I_14910 [Winogradskyella sp.]
MSEIPKYNILVEAVKHIEVEHFIDANKTNYSKFKFDVSDYTETLKETSDFFYKYPNLDVDSFFKDYYDSKAVYTLVSIFSNFKSTKREILQLAESIKEKFETNIFLTNEEGLAVDKTINDENANT